MKQKMTLLIFSMITLPCFSLNLVNDSPSNLNLKNNTGSPLTVYGLYLYGVAFISPDDNCQNGIGNAGQNYTENQGMQGSMVSPISFAVGQSISISQNFLYNMLYNFLYWRVAPNGANSGPICALPGCSWSTDTAQYKWCFKVGAVSPNASYTFTPYETNSPPYAWPTNGVPVYPYNYDLVNNASNYVWIGPFTCNDQTLTCFTGSPQTQPFGP